MSPLSETEEVPKSCPPFVQSLRDFSAADMITIRTPFNSKHERNKFAFHGASRSERWKATEEECEFAELAYIPLDVNDLAESVRI